MNEGQRKIGETENGLSCRLELTALQVLPSPHMTPTGQVPKKSPRLTLRNLAQLIFGPPNAPLTEPGVIR